jgi:hypothetical protein
MALLIPDARRGLLGGLIDDATLLRPSAPPVEHAVAAYRALRATENGWMVGRFVVPVSRLEELAGVVVGTMRSGDPWVPIVAAFDGETASNASIAAAFHATLDPAARIEVVHLGHQSPESIDGIVDAVAAGNGIHRGALSMAAVPLGMPASGVMDAISAARTEGLRPVGAWIDLSSNVFDPVALSSVIRASVRSSVPFTVAVDHLPAVTRADTSGGGHEYGVLNLLAASLQADTRESEAAAVLSDSGPQTYTIEFGGLARNGEIIHSRRSIGVDRSPLVSLATCEPLDTISALGGLDHPF